MAEHLHGDPFVLGLGRRSYAPNLHPYRHQFETRPTAESVLAWDADVVILNRHWVGARTTMLGNALRRAGYREEVSFGYDEPRWQRVLAGRTIGAADSNVEKVDPPITLRRRARDAY
jgi:hypothetical protein